MSVRRAVAVAALPVAMTLLAGCSPEGEDTSGAEIDRTPCAVQRLADPACGVLLGITTQEHTMASLASFESRTGRRLDLVYRFHDIDDEITADERRLVADGRLLHISIDARYFDGERLAWSDVAMGRYDAALRRQAAGIAAMRRPVFVTFEHEADQPDKQVQGSGPEFVAAWRHVREVFNAAGASNAIWVWVMMGTADGLPRAAQLWPGNDVVDWISWDVYNSSGCRMGAVDPNRYVSFKDSARLFYDWLMKHRLTLGIDTSKPMMISEAGSVLYPQAMHRTAGWYADIPAVVRSMPQVKAVSLWDREGKPGCDYRFSGTPEIRDAVATMAEDPMFAGFVPAP